MIAPEGKQNGFADDHSSAEAVGIADVEGDDREIELALADELLHPLGRLFTEGHLNRRMGSVEARDRARQIEASKGLHRSEPNPSGLKPGERRDFLAAGVELSQGTADAGDECLACCGQPHAAA